MLKHRPALLTIGGCGHVLEVKISRHGQLLLSTKKCFCCPDAEEDLIRGISGRQIYGWTGHSETQRLGEGRIQSVTGRTAVLLLWHMHMSGVVVCVLLNARPVCGCSWWRSSGREWSWRRCRSSRSTRCPPSSASRRSRCSCRTYELASSSYAKLWWEFRHDVKKLKSVELFLQSKHLKLWNVFTGNLIGVISGQTGIRLEAFFRHLTASCMYCKLASLQKENVVWEACMWQWIISRPSTQADA